MSSHALHWQQCYGSLIALKYDIQKAHENEQQVPGRSKIAWQCASWCVVASLELTRRLATVRITMAWLRLERAFIFVKAYVLQAGHHSSCSQVVKARRLCSATWCEWP